MATYYARNVTGNWAANTSWDSASSGGAGPAGPPVAGDTAIFDSGFTGTITIAAAAACAVLTVQAGATGTLAWGAFTLATTSNVTFVSGFTLTGATGRLTISGTSTITSGGLTIPGNVTLNGGATYTLADALTIAGQLFIGASTVFSGAFNITCADFLMTVGTPQFVSGQRLIVTNSFILQPSANSAGQLINTIRAVTASSVAYIEYTGTAANVRVFATNFTDIDWSTYSTPVTGLDNWYGGTLTRTVGITNRSSSDIGGGSGAGAWSHRMIGGGF